MDKIRQIALEYFETHPEAKADMIRKGRKEWRSSHRFHYSKGETRCWICGTDWYSKDIDECPGFKRSDSSISGVIRSEEEKAFDLMEKCERDVARIVPQMGMNGKTLAVLHHTYGHDPETVLTAIELAPFRAEYESEMEKERARSRAAQVKQSVSAVL